MSFQAANIDFGLSDNTKRINYEDTDLLPLLQISIRIFYLIALNGHFIILKYGDKLS